MQYFYQLNPNGGVFSASKCKCLQSDMFLIISPDLRLAQVARQPRPEMIQHDELGRLIFWKGLLMIGKTLPLLNTIQLPCGECGRFGPLSMFTSSQICTTCRVPNRGVCLCCNRRVPVDLLLGDRCLVCITVSGILLRHNISPQFEEIPNLFGIFPDREEETH